MSPTVATKPFSLRCPRGYQAIEPALLETRLACDSGLYALPNNGGALAQLTKPGQAISNEQLMEVRESEQQLLASHAGFLRMCERLQERLPEVLCDGRLSQALRLSVLMAYSASEANHAATLLKPGCLIQLSKQVAMRVFELLRQGEVVPEELFHAPRYGRVWFSHSVSVSCYSVLLAIALGVRAEDDLRRIALGGMLHDLGQWNADRSEGKDPRDASQGKSTSPPQAGYEMLLDDPELDRRQLMMIYQHKESPDGRGYPVGVTADEIEPWAALVKVVDVFDEITTDPDDPHRRRLGIALERLRDQAGENFDREAVQCWTQLMSRA